MKTILTDDPEVAAQFIRRGQLSAFPTETVYGLGADVFNETAVADIFAAKRRPADNPLIVHIADISQIQLLASSISATAEKLIAALFPGPLTVVLARSSAVSDLATAGLETIAIRMPRNTVARAFLSACGTPVAAPSANLSGKPSPTTWQAVAEDLDGRIQCILQSDPTEIGLESTVVDCTTEEPTILRTGAVSIEDLRMVVPNIEMFRDDAVGSPRSPGMKHRHYSPRAKVILTRNAASVELDKNDAYIGISKPATAHALSRIFDSVEEYAHSVFEFFRDCDRAGIKVIYCEVVSETGIGAALMDRLRRAADK